MTHASGKERDSLHDVIFFLRRKPLTSSGDGHAIELAMPAPKAAAQAMDAANHAGLDDEDRLIEENRMREFRTQSSSGGLPPPIPEDLLALVIGETGTDLYESVTMQGGKPVVDDNPFVDENGVEPL